MEHKLCLLSLCSFFAKLINCDEIDHLDPFLNILSAKQLPNRHYIAHYLNECKRKKLDLLKSIGISAARCINVCKYLTQMSFLLISISALPIRISCIMRHCVYPDCTNFNASVFNVRNHNAKYMFRKSRTELTIC